MRDFLHILLIIYFFTGCIDISGADNEERFKNHSEFNVKYSKNVTHEIKGFLKGFSSIIAFSPKEKGKIRVAADSYTNLTFALNENSEPIFAALPNQRSTYIFGSENTALAVLSTLITPFSDQPHNVLIDKIQSSDHYLDLVDRIDHLSLQNESFLYDEQTNSLFNDISTSLTNLISNKKESKTHPQFTYDIIEGNKLKVGVKSKLPFSLRSKYSITQEENSNTVLEGLPLKIEHSDNDSEKSFNVLSGAHEISITSDLKSQKERIAKLTRDIILKTHLILGIDSQHYTDGNGIEEMMKTSFSSKNETQSYSKSQIFEWVNKKLFKKNELITHYLLDEISEEIISTSNTTMFLSFVQELIYNQKEKSFIYQYESFYDELSTQSDYQSSQDICIENNSIVPCSVAVKEVLYDINSSGCFENEYRIEFGSGYFAPYGLDKGSKLRIEWEFSPQGNSGLWLIGIPNSKYKTTGRTLTTGCFNFGQTESLKLSLSLTDHEGRKSNLSSLVIDKPKSKSLATSSQTASASLIE
ncbi:MAG: hypothetical protein JXR20_10165 [Balneola sp.]